MEIVAKILITLSIICWLTGIGLAVKEYLSSEKTYGHLIISLYVMSAFFSMLNLIISVAILDTTFTWIIEN